MKEPGDKLVVKLLLGEEFFSDFEISLVVSMRLMFKLT